MSRFAQCYMGTMCFLCRMTSHVHTHESSPSGCAVPQRSSLRKGRVGEDERGYGEVKYQLCSRMINDFQSKDSGFGFSSFDFL